MEFLTILLSGILGLVSPAGLVVDRIAANTIRSQFDKVDQLSVRVDNAPTYQLIQGRVERVRIAGRGLQLKQQDIRIDTLELETDPVDLELGNQSQKQPKLKRPINAGVHLVLTQQDINRALRSPQLTAFLTDLGISEFGDSVREQVKRYYFVNPQIELLENNRLRFHVELQEKGNNNPLAITVESGLGVLAGRQLQLLNPSVYVDKEAVPPELIKELASNLEQQLNLRKLEAYGFTARILQLKVKAQKLELATFLRVEPSFQFLETRRSAM